MTVIYILFVGLCLVAIYYAYEQTEAEFEIEEWDDSDQLYLQYLLENTNEQSTK